MRSEKTIKTVSLRRSFFHYSFENVKRYVDAPKPTHLYSHFVLFRQKGCNTWGCPGSQFCGPPKRCSTG